MSKLKIQGNTSGTGVITLVAPNTDTDRTITLPDESTTLGGVDGIVSTANATAITIDSSENVGIGTSTPGYTSGQQPGTFQTIYSSDTNGGILELASNKNTDNNTLGIISFVNTENSNSGATTRVYNAQIRGRIDTSDANAGDDSGGVLEFQTKAEAGPLDVSMTIASDGNVGIGVVPKTWHSSLTGLQVGDSGAISGGTTAWGGYCEMGANFYRDAGGFKRLISNYACQTEYNDASGDIKFRVAPSGTADSAVSWTNALTITNDGRGISQFTARAWCNVNFVGTVSIRDSHNISSITDNGTGNVQFNFTNSMGNANFVYFGFIPRQWGDEAMVAENTDYNGREQSTSRAIIGTRGASTGNYLDSPRVMLGVFGD